MDMELHAKCLLKWIIKEQPREPGFLHVLLCRPRSVRLFLRVLPLVLPGGCSIPGNTYAQGRKRPLKEKELFVGLFFFFFFQEQLNI